MADNTERLVTFDQAKALKALGFNYECQGHYTLNGDLYRYSAAIPWNHNAYLDEYACYSAPTLELVAKWLREKRGIFTLVQYKNTSWVSRIVLMYDGANIGASIDKYPSYEDALSACIDKAIYRLIDYEKEYRTDENY